VPATMLPGSILTRWEARPTTRADRPSVADDCERVAREHRERAGDLERSAVLLAAQARDCTGIEADALRVLSRRQRHLAIEVHDVAAEAERLAGVLWGGR